ncbi:MAG: flavohemoglobin expression-modulating QEGLA motif protein [Parvularculaceae bacterium]
MRVVLKELAFFRRFDDKVAQTAIPVHWVAEEFWSDMAAFSAAELGRLRAAGSLLLEAEDRLPVLRTLSWDRAVGDAFLKSGGLVPPAPAYPQIDPEPSRQRIAAARALIDGESPVHDWLRRFADMAEMTAAMLSAIGTVTFHVHSRALYGAPSSPIADGKRNALELARRLDALLADLEGGMRLEPPKILGAAEIKRRLDTLLPEHFGADSPRVEVTPNVSGKAAAGRDYIKLREDAMFSDLDVTQLLQHEAFVHIATGKNGQAQANFPLLAESHPGNAKTQEGLAVFAEFISGALDPRRFRRLADRVMAIDMAERGADFIEVFRFFREQSATDAPFEAFENARRVFRGGVIAGGAPFTKDSIYLGGLLEVHNFLRAAVKSGDAGYIRLLFVGKIDLADLAAMKMLRDEELIAPPRFMPPWATDLRYLLSYLAYSTFLNEISLKDVVAKYEPLFA